MAARLPEHFGGIDFGFVVAVAIDVVVINVECGGQGAHGQHLGLAGNGFVVGLAHGGLAVAVKGCLKVNLLGLDWFGGFQAALVNGGSLQSLLCLLLLQMMVARHGIQFVCGQAEKQI